MNANAAIYAPPPPSWRYPSPAWDWETLKPDYSNVRGLNYVPVYPSLYDSPPTLNPPQRFFGSASPVGTWRFWQTHDVDQQLGWMKGLGCNAIRVFLSFPVWRHEEDARRPGAKNLFVQRFEELLRLCEKHRLYLMPVLWDGFSPVGRDPSATPYDDIGFWPRSPGVKDATVAWAQSSGGEEFVRAVCEAGRDSPAVFLWDLGNEPDGLWFDWFAFMARLVRDADPNPAHGITVSFAAYPDFLENRVPSIPEITVISFHPYGVFRQNIAEWVRMARRSARPPIADRQKPILATEGGSPGLLMPFQNFFRQMRDEGVGFMSWVAFIDDVRGGIPFDSGAGFLFADGEVREVAGVDALQRFAKEDGVLSFQLRSRPTKTDLTGFQRGFPPYTVDDALADIQPLRWSQRAGYNDRTGNQFFFENAVLNNLTTWGLGTLASVTQPRGILTAEEEGIVRAFGTEALLHDLLRGRFPWLIGNPLRIDWERYYSFMTDWGIALWKIITRNGFRG